jgi:predicted nucleic-acid-binding protein
MTYGCDTSFLMRILTNHPRPLATKVIVEAYRRVQQGDAFEISDLTLSEAYYSLQASYGVPKADALALLKKISEARGFVVSDHARDVLALPNLAKSSPGFVDRLIHGEYFAGAKTTVACEKSFRKLPLAEVFAVGDKAT